MDNSNKNTFKIGQLRVWWIPQVPMKPFYVYVDSIYEAVKIMDVLALYDAFQFINNIKPDYCNAGGVEICEQLEGESSPEWNMWWIDVDGEYFEDPREFVRVDPNKIKTINENN